MWYSFTSSGVIDMRSVSYFKGFATEEDKRGDEIMIALMGSQGLGWEGEGFDQARELDATRHWLLPWSLGWRDLVDPQFTRILFWFTGHPIVYFWLLPIYVSWYMFLPKQVGGKLYSDGITRMVFLAFLLLLPMVPVLGVNINGARIWVTVGPINFQPGEFAKIALAVFFAAYFADNRELIAAKTWKVGPLRLPEPRFILPVLLAWGFAVVVMVGQRDLGSSLLFFTLFVVMIWVATERVGWLLLGAALFAAALSGGL